MRGKTIRTARQREEFLAALGNGRSVSTAARAAHMGRSAVYAWRRDDPEFAADWDDAIEMGTDALEDEAIRRAKDRAKKSVYHQGQQCGMVREYSDVLLIFMLKAPRPEKYRDRYEVRAKVSVSDDLRGKSIEELRRELAKLRAEQDAVGSP